MKKYLFVLAAALFIAGCGSGGGGSASSSLNVSGDSAEVLGGGSPVVGGAIVDDGGQVGAILVHNPEPATMILFGIGVAGIASKVLKKRKKA